MTAAVTAFATARLSRPFPPAHARDPYDSEIAVAVRPRGPNWGVALVSWNGERWRTGSWLAGPFIIYARETPAFMPGRDSAAALAAPVLAPPLNYCYLHIKRNKM